MSPLIHLLGSDIPHHNQTLLTFFNRVLAERVPGDRPRHFMVVSGDLALADHYPELKIEIFPSKKALASAVSGKAKHRRQQFFCHGQFNPWLWLALLVGKIQSHQLHWHIWGADLYEDSAALKFRLFYRLRRLAQARVASVWATCGDISYFRQRHPSVPACRLYFPGRMPETPVSDNPLAEQGPFTLLIGNSGDRSNRHCQALERIYQQFGQNVRLIIPMGYPPNNQHYIQQVRSTAERLFSPQQVIILLEQLNFEAYQQLLSQCQLGYFIFERQQGIGTLSLLILRHIPFVVSRLNPFWQDLAAGGLPVIFDDETLNPARVQAAQQQLNRLDIQKIAFLSPGYISGWCEMLVTLEGEKT